MNSKQKTLYPTIQYSQKIADILDSHSGDNDSDFWDFMNDEEIADVEWYRPGSLSDVRFDGLLQDGFKLANESEGKPIHCYTTAYNGWYFIGDEDEIVSRIETGWKAWQTQYVAPKPVLEKKDKQRLKKAQKQLEKLTAMLEGIDELECLEEAETILDCISTASRFIEVELEDNS